jgi:outer membrane protein assembly factor BamE (lipoprotein component of BamABCDE complex)
MYNLKLIIPFLIFILSSCTQTFQKNGLSEKKIETFDIKIGKTSKKFLIDNYGPPIFENVFNNNVIYYVSHSTSYKTFDDRKTDKLLVFEITLDNKNIVKKYKKYSDKDSLDIKVVRNNDNKDIDLTSFWKDLVRALRRTNNLD